MQVRGAYVEKVGQKMLDLFRTYWAHMERLEVGARPAGVLPHAAPCCALLAHAGPCCPMLPRAAPCCPMLRLAGPCCPMLRLAPLPACSGLVGCELVVGRHVAAWQAG